MILKSVWVEGGRGHVDDLESRLEVASKRREVLASECQRIEGRLEAAEANLRALEAECRAKGVDPDAIDDVISKLEVRLASLVEQVELEIAKADEALAPFLKES